MVRIRLQRQEWYYDPAAPLDKPGGFATVFPGHDSGHGALAVKRLNGVTRGLQHAVHHELRLAHMLVDRDLVYVMPVLDAGKDPGSGAYFVVMPRADRTLQEELDRGERFAPTEAAEILLQIARGLAEVPDLVHQDLKPRNVLLHAGRWKIADFGTADFDRFGMHGRARLKPCASPPYAAPEQWRTETATPKTDVYALGCIGYALLTGEPPFPGPEKADYRRQHLEEEPVGLNGDCQEFVEILTRMLDKDPARRPSLQAAMGELSRAAGPGDGSPAGTGAGLPVLGPAVAVVGRLLRRVLTGAGELRSGGSSRSAQT
jgi:serine/threonine protein kinase